MKGLIRTTLIMLLAMGSSMLYGQKRVHFSELEMQADGRFYQINTIPPFTGIAFEVHPPQNEKQKERQRVDPIAYLRNGPKREEVSFKEGKPNGLAKGWDELGQKIYEANMVDGVQQGIEKQWYPSGKLKSEVPFEQGKPNGLAVQYWENGNKRSEGQFLVGYEEGIHNWWFEDGAKDQQVEYQAGTVNGFVKNWYPDGTLKLQSSYRQGQQDGLTTEYYKNSQKKAEGSYQKGLEEGLFKAWNRKGKLLDEKTYEEGTLIQSKDFRNAGIRTSEGFEQVYNQMGTHYQVSVHGDEVNTVNSWNVAFTVDGKYLQMLSVPVESFSNELADPKQILQALKSREIKNAEADLKQALDVESKMGQLDNQLDWLFWSFENPNAGDAGRRVLQEQFLGLYLGGEVLLLSSVVTDQDRPDQIEAFLVKIAKGVQRSEEPIDINSIRNAAIGK
ncbi:MAG: toxin-antitoxin system YwqK family antitoxin [Bacteroidota bacterium]